MVVLLRNRLCKIYNEGLCRYMLKNWENGHTEVYAESSTGVEEKVSVADGIIKDHIDLINYSKVFRWI